MNTQKFKNNGHSKFPISTDTFDFMQEQIKLLHDLTSIIGGKYVIISMPSGTTPGLVVFNGELMPLTGGVNQYITAYETYESVTFKEETIQKARIIHKARFTSSRENSTSYPFSEFSYLKTNSQLAIAIESAEQHLTPKGTVIDWYGEASFDNIPYGWIPCGGFFPSKDMSSVNAEITKWKQQYSQITIDLQYNDSTYYCIIEKLNGMDIPYLSGRFIVGAGINDGSDDDYSLGDTGGKESVLLTSAESGVPAHSHHAQLSGYTIQKVIAEVSGFYQKGNTGAFGTDTLASVMVEGDTNYNVESNAKEAHENRPPYFALYKLIKVI